MEFNASSFVFPAFFELVAELSHEKWGPRFGMLLLVIAFCLSAAVILQGAITALRKVLRARRKIARLALRRVIRKESCVIAKWRVKMQIVRRRRQIPRAKHRRLKTSHTVPFGQQLPSARFYGLGKGIQVRLRGPRLSCRLRAHRLRLSRP